MTKKKVFVGMSGGVDSSVAAILLKQQGYDPIGYTLRLWDGVGTQAATACNDAAKVCETLGITHMVIDFRNLFWEKIIDPFLSVYASGRTPNPCVNCNKYIKFGAMYHEAKRLGADYVATGHYAKIIKDLKSNRYFIQKAKDEHKDQTYVLYHLLQEQIQDTLFPLGDYSKEQIRSIAKDFGLSVASKAESQDICFIEGAKVEDFMRVHAPQLLIKGEIVNEDGQVLGVHNGICLYTIGQRRGLGISSTERMYVSGIDAINHRVILSREEKIFATKIMLSHLNFLPFDTLNGPISVQAKIRYAAPPADAVISPAEDGKVWIVFHQRQRAPTPGQSVVFYQGKILVGGGIICEVQYS